MRNLKTNSLLFELSQPGRRAARLPECDVPAPPAEKLLPADAISDQPPPLPEVAEPEVVRHFTNLSTLNMSVDTHFYPLGSCTMKYNPKRHERLAGLHGIVDLHPYQPEADIQGMLELLYTMQEMLAEKVSLFFFNRLVVRRCELWLLARQPVIIQSSFSERHNFGMERQFTQVDAAQPKAPEIAARTATDLA